MKITFEGTPKQILQEMKEYIVRAGLEFGEIHGTEHSVNQIKPRNAQLNSGGASERVYPMPKIVEIPPKSPEIPRIPQEIADSRRDKCKHCGKICHPSGVRRHEFYCNRSKSNRLVEDYVNGKYDHGLTTSC